jgi:hypothetical protein
MLRCASSFVIAAYAKIRLIPQDSRALPANFLRSRPIFETFKTLYEAVGREAFGLLAMTHGPFSKGLAAGRLSGESTSRYGISGGYMPSISSRYFSRMTFLFNFSDGVSSPVFSERGCLSSR